MPASLIVFPYTILEISKFLGQLPVDDDDDEKCQLNAGIASLRSELTRDTHCANDLAPRTSAFCPRISQVYFLRSQSMYPGNQTSLTM